MYYSCCYSKWLTAGLVQSIMIVAANLTRSTYTGVFCPFTVVIGKERRKHVFFSSMLEVLKTTRNPDWQNDLTVVSCHIAFCPLGRVSHCSINTFSPEDAVSTVFLFCTIPLILINVANTADVFSSSRVLNIIELWMQQNKWHQILHIHLSAALPLFISRTVK